MSITLDGITLPQDLLWSDEYTWQPIAQSKQQTLTGGQVVQEGARTKGRTITLESKGAAWVTRATVDALWAAQTADRDMTLDYHGTSYTVRWDFENGAMEAQQVQRIGNPGNFQDRYYTIKLQLFEV